MAHLPSMNFVARQFIVSESFFWSAWSILLPLISVFALSEISSATIQNLSFAYSVYLLLRVTGSLISSFGLNKLPIRSKIQLILVGILFISLSYIGFIPLTTINGIYIVYGTIGLFTGIISPLRASIFSTHLDKKRETTEWGLLDAVVLTTIALAASFSGWLVTAYGYKSVFILSALLNTVSMIPYFFLLQSTKRKKS